MEQIIIKFKKPLLIIASILVVYSLLGFVAVPMLLESKIPELVKEQTGKKASLTGVKFDPFGLKLSIKGFELNELDGGKIFSLKELYLNYGLWSSIKYWAAAVDKIYLDEPLINIVRGPDGTINLTQLTVPDENPVEPEEAESEEVFPVWLGIIRINDGEIDINDYSLPEPYVKQITSLNLDIEKLATIALDDQQDDSLSLSFADGGVITWDGDIQLAPVMTLQGHIEIKEFDSVILWDYIRHELGFEIAQGKWNIETDYIFSTPEDQTLLALSNSHLTLSKVLGESSLLEWNGQVDVLPQTRSTGKVNITAVSVNDLWQFVPKDVEFKISQGTLDLSSDYAFSMTQDAEPEISAQLSNSQLVLSDLFDQGDSIKWHGESTTVLPDIISNGSVAVEGLNLHKIWLQIQKQLDLKIQTGQLNLNSDYTFQQLKNEQEPQLQLSNAHIDAQTVALSAKDSEQALVTVGSFAIDQLGLDLQKREAQIDSIKTDNGSILTIINSEGEVNLSTAFTGRASGKVMEHAEEAVPEATSDPWLVNVKSLAVQNYLLDFTQQTTGKPVKLKVTPINVAITDFSTAKNKSFQIKTDLTINKSGKISTDGKMTLEPMSLAMNINASKLALTAFQPFIAESTRLLLTSGKVGLKSKLNIKQSKAGKTQLQVTGNFDINSLKMVEAGNKKDFLKWKKVDLKQFKFNLEPMSLSAKSLNIQNLNTEVIVNKDKSTNVNYLFSPATSKKGKPPQKTKAAKPKAKQKQESFALDIKKVNIKDAAGFYADRSLILPFAANIKQLNGSITNVSSNKKARSKIHLQGKANETAPLLIQGEVVAFDVEDYMNILMQFSDMSMTGMTPYMAEFGGYKIEKGKLSVNLLYKINNGQLQAENQIVINQLTLGDEVESPNAVDLPIKLALGLLKDRHGTIDLGLPVEGNLNDPEFSVWGVVGDVFMNMMTKVIASPFSAMGSLLNTDADLSQVVFAPGSKELDTTQRQMLDILTQGLLQRPQLQLQIRGTAFEKEDGVGLASLNIIRQIKTEIWKDLDSDERPADIDNTPMTDEEYHDLLTDLYEEKFNDKADQLVDLAEDASDSETAKGYYQQMLQDLAKADPADQHELSQLATGRARVIKNYLIETGHIPANRVFMLGQTVLEKTKEGTVVVELELGVSD